MEQLHQIRAPGVQRERKMKGSAQAQAAGEQEIPWLSPPGCTTACLCCLYSYRSPAPLLSPELLQNTTKGMAKVVSTLSWGSDTAQGSLKQLSSVQRCILVLLFRYHKDETCWTRGSHVFAKCWTHTLCLWEFHSVTCISKEKIKIKPWKFWPWQMK